MKTTKTLLLPFMVCLFLNACISASKEPSLEPLSSSQKTASDFNGQWNGYVQIKVAQGLDSIETGGTFPLVFSKDSLTVPLGVFNEKYFDGTLVKCKFLIDVPTNTLTISNPKTKTEWGSYASSYQYSVKKMPDVVIANTARMQYKFESLNSPNATPSSGRIHRWYLTKRSN